MSIYNKPPRSLPLFLNPSAGRPSPVARSSSPASASSSLGPSPRRATSVSLLAPRRSRPASSGTNPRKPKPRRVSPRVAPPLRNLDSHKAQPATLHCPPSGKVSPVDPSSVRTQRRASSRARHEGHSVSYLTGVINFELIATIFKLRGLCQKKNKECQIVKYSKLRGHSCKKPIYLFRDYGFTFLLLSLLNLVLIT